MDRQNKKYSCTRKSGRRKNNPRTDKEEEKQLAGLLAKKELPAEGCSRIMLLNLWCSDHLWSSTSALVVLQK